MLVKQVDKALLESMDDPVLMVPREHEAILVHLVQMDFQAQRVKLVNKDPREQPVKLANQDCQDLKANEEKTV